MSAKRCHQQSSIDRHFAGRITTKSERRLRQHLPTCAACRQYYDRHLLLAAVDPESPSPVARIGRGLGLQPRRTSFALPVASLLTAAALLACVLLWLPSRGAPSFVARGSETQSRLFVYRVTDTNASVPIAGAMAAGDELAFAYDNASEKSQLMVFGVDEHQHVYWYHPAWTSEKDNPGAIVIPAVGGINELPEAIRHALDGSRLVVYALFSDRKLSVRDIEGAVRNGSVEELSTMNGAVLDRVFLKVGP